MCSKVENKISKRISQWFFQRQGLLTLWFLLVIEISLFPKKVKYILQSSIILLNILKDKYIGIESTKSAKIKSEAKRGTLSKIGQ